MVASTPTDLALAAGFFLAPFVQEDAAVLGAAAASANNPVSVPLFLAVVTLGLMLSDIWKYFAGRYAKHLPVLGPWVDKIAKPSLVERLNKHAIGLLMVARFVPGTRIPLYVACGVARVPIVLFCVVVTLSGMLYVALAYALFAIVGEVAGRNAPIWFAIIAGTVLAVVLLRAFIQHRMRRRAA
jgi:membrane protein DedA with SNARE-associated domain